jgi:hypothetical protein
MDESLFKFPKSEAQQIISELNKLIKSQNEVQNLISLEKVIDILGDYTLSEFATTNFIPVLTKLDVMKTIIDEKPESVQIEFGKIMNIILDKPIKKKPYVVVLSESSITPEQKKEKEIAKLKEITAMLRKSQKKKDELETAKLRILSNQKEKQRVERMKKSVKKYLEDKKDKKIKIKPKVKRN